MIKIGLIGINVAVGHKHPFPELETKLREKKGYTSNVLASLSIIITHLANCIFAILCVCVCVCWGFTKCKTCCEWRIVEQ